MTLFIRALEVDDKGELLLRVAADSSSPACFDVQLSEFRRLPKTPLAYWLSEELREIYEELPNVSSTGCVAKQGLATGDNFRHIRLWWELFDAGSSGHWWPFANGGKLSPFYGDVQQLIGYDRGHQEALKVTGRFGRGADFYERPGLTWSVRSARFAPSALPSGTVFSHRGYCLFADRSVLLSYCALLNSSVVDFLFKVSLGRFSFPEFLVGVVPTLPVPVLQDRDLCRLQELARNGWTYRRSLDTAVEVSHAFTLPALLQVSGRSFDTRVTVWADQVAGIEVEMARLQSTIDELCFELYGISEPDQRVIVEGFGVDGEEEGIRRGAEDTDDDNGEIIEPVPAVLAAGLVSWAVGVAVGRFDLRLATDQRPWPDEPDPFDPLPMCSPGMLTGEDGLPLVKAPPEYGIDVSPVLVDDPGHRLDITVRVRSVFDAVFGQDADRWWADVGMALGAKSGEVGGWLARGFFDHHLKMYSRSRRKAPILWPIGTRTGSYAVWLYAHQVSSDSLFQILNDIVARKQRVEEREMTQQRQDVGPDPTASQRKVMDTQERFVGELRELREELEAVAPLWAPDLNDGIVIVLAPLWRLFAHHRAWSRELKKHWVKLATGDYDWAQLAMRLWPDRVVPKCVIDRSLAIAHGLEDVFWVQDPGNEDKWIPREIPARPIKELIAQRHSPATIAAVQRVST